MRSTPLLALMAALGPVVVLSSPRPPSGWGPPPGWDMEMITVSFDAAGKVHHPPHIPGATTTATDNSLAAGASPESLSPTITSKPQPQSDECANEGSSSLSLVNYPNKLRPVPDSGAATANSSSSTPVAKHRRQVDASIPTTTTSIAGADKAISAGVLPPNGYAGTAGLAGNAPSITPGAIKKVNGNGCAQGPGKYVDENPKLNTFTTSAMNNSAVAGM